MLQHHFDVIMMLALRYVFAHLSSQGFINWLIAISVWIILYIRKYHQERCRDNRMISVTSLWRNFVTVGLIQRLLKFASGLLNVLIWSWWIVNHCDLWFCWFLLPFVMSSHPNMSESRASKFHSLHGKLYLQKAGEFYHMRTSSWHGNAFCITGPLWGESTSHWWIPLARASNSEL